MLYTCRYKWTSDLCFSLLSQEFHLEYDKLEERPHVPTTFNYNPAQQAFWSRVRQRQQTASRPAWPQKNLVLFLNFWTRTAGGGGGGEWRGSPPWELGEMPCLTNYVLPEHKTSIYFHSVFKFSSYVFFLLLLLPPFHFEQGQCFVYSADGKPLLVFAWSLWSCSTAHKTHPFVFKRKTQFALCFPKCTALTNRTDTKTNPIHVNTQGRKKMQCSLLHYLVIKEHKNCFLLFFQCGKSHSRRLEGHATLSLTSRRCFFGFPRFFISRFFCSIHPHCSSGEVFSA